ncbi:MAG: magnesium transporter [Dehalococcoidia bacterium]
MEQAAEKLTEKTPPAEQVVRHLLEQGQAREAAQAVAALHVADGAGLVGRLEPQQQIEVVRHLEPDQTAQLLAQLDTSDAVAIANALDDAAVSNILDRTSPDVAADILRAFPPERRQRTIDSMARARDVSPLLPYEDESAGGLMVPEFVVLREWMTAEESIAYLRGAKPPAESSNYLFVLDRRNALSGVVNLRDLVLAPAETLVRELMNPNVITVKPGTDQEECARVMSRYDLVQLPVADDQNQVLGVILSEDIIDVLEEEATEDMMRLASIGVNERVLGPFRRGFRSRLPWLLLNLGTVILAAAIINIFEDTIRGAVFLAVFLPMVASQGGIAGTQTLTMVTRGLALGELTLANSGRLLRREIALGVANGVVFGLIAGALAYAWKGNADLGIVVGLAMVLNLLVAGMFGAAVPLALKAMRMDPALGSAVLLTTVTDVAGFGFVLTLAAWLLV